MGPKEDGRRWGIRTERGETRETLTIETTGHIESILCPVLSFSPLILPTHSFTFMKTAVRSSSNKNLTGFSKENKTRHNIYFITWWNSLVIYQKRVNLGKGGWRKMRGAALGVCVWKEMKEKKNFRLDLIGNSPYFSACKNYSCFPQNHKPDDNSFIMSLEFFGQLCRTHSNPPPLAILQHYPIILFIIINHQYGVKQLPPPPSLPEKKFSELSTTMTQLR